MKNKDKNQNILPRKEVDSVIALYSDGKIEDAIDEIKLLNEDYPNEPILFNIIGACYKSLGDLEASSKMFESAIEIKPDYAEAHFNYGVVLRGLNDSDGAIQSYKRAISIMPNYVDAYNNLGNLFKELGKEDEAIENYEWAIAYKHDFFQAHNNLGLVQSENHQSELAIKSYQNAVRIAPDFLDAHFNLGITFAEIGNQKMAIKSFEKVLKINSSHTESYRNLATVKVFKVKDPQIKFMESLLSNKELSNSEYIDLNFALASVYENLDDKDQQFKFLLEGNKLKKKQLNYSVDDDKKRFSVLKKMFKKPLSQITINKDKKYNIQPIFIVGMPRSGTSLVEQILASHNDIFGAGELKNLAEYSIPLLNKILKSESKSISKKELTGLRSNYLSSISKIKTSKNIVVDKMPLNFQYIGLILSAMPEAKIIHIKRDARAICWSNYNNYFSSKGNGFSFDQSDLANYYNLYSDLMEFWHKTFPKKIYDLNYENLTFNQKEETQNLLNYCEVGWDENCLNFYDNNRAVKTVSSYQVRRKMYKGSSDAWKQYKEYLSPLLKDLDINT